VVESLFRGSRSAENSGANLASIRGLSTLNGPLDKMWGFIGKIGILGAAWAAFIRHLCYDGAVNAERLTFGRRRGKHQTPKPKHQRSSKLQCLDCWGVTITQIGDTSLGRTKIRPNQSKSNQIKPEHNFASGDVFHRFLIYSYLGQFRHLQLSNWTQTPGLHALFISTHQDAMIFNLHQRAGCTTIGT
jgi:hypothetical protein